VDKLFKSWFGRFIFFFGYMILGIAAVAATIAVLMALVGFIFGTLMFGVDSLFLFIVVVLAAILASITKE
jgi:hypothetical protein